MTIPRVRWSVLLVVTMAVVSGCTSFTSASRTSPGAPDCYVMYDAGSSGSRLYIYERAATGWTAHRGPKTPALADPARGNRGKTMADAGETVDAMVAALDDMRVDGPPNRKGTPLWTAFDWRRQCHVVAAYVYGTAGMRIAERQNNEAAALMWDKVRTALAERLKVPVTARTLTAYEEGLFAWLALHEKLVGNRFGVAELGGGSLQVTFPCPGCEDTQRVRVRGRLIDIYSHSFLGWGQDVAWHEFGRVAACEPGAGLTDPDWKTSDCEAVMRGFSDVAAPVADYVRAEKGLHWYLSDAFYYMGPDDIADYCQNGLDSGYEPESSCFRAVYQQYVLKSLALPLDAEKSALNWTLGAVVCTATQCLQAGGGD